MVTQSKRKSHGNERFWRYLAQLEINEGQKTLKDLHGVHTVIILDISASMAEENAWTHAFKFLRDYLIGLDDISKRYGLSDEYVALVTFGHDTKVQHRLTNNYKLLRKLVESQQLGGPSPLYGGLALAIAAAGSSNHQVDRVNNVTVFTKVIIVTDGYLTEVGQFEGPDVAEENLDETKAKLIQCMEEFKGHHLDTFYVQVGKGSETKIQDPFGIDPLSLLRGSQSFTDFSEEDKQMIEEIKCDARKGFLAGIEERNSTNKYREMSGSNLPPIGSRVRRGPDWHWGMQDSNGPGTVTGHDDGEQVWVKWDEDGHHNVYRYGKPGYDVLIVDEPRKLKFGQKIAVGCVVRPGKDWTKSTGKAQNWQRGVVIKVKEPRATVCWDNEERGDYTYSGTGKCEIEICSGFTAFRSEGHVLGSDVRINQPEKRKTNKNRNVNIH